MELNNTSINGVFTYVPKKFLDNRGYFAEIYNKNNFLKITEKEFVQDNQSLSVEKNIFRGLHFQIEPYAQDKLIWVTKGKVIDVVLDLREKSKTFLQHELFELSEDNFSRLWVPKGCANGVLIMKENTILNYKVTNFYSPECERGISIFDKKLKIILPIKSEKLILSDKDSKLDVYKENDKFFTNL